MRTIYKYPLKFDDYVNIRMPRGAEVLHAGYQGDALFLWAMVDPDAEMQRRRFRVAGTGHPIKKDVVDHISTIIKKPYVWHIFEVNT